MQEITHYPGTEEVTIRNYKPEEIAAMEALALPTFRATAQCSRLQGILALGEARWAKVLTYRDTATWAERIIIEDASDWHRASENIQFLGYLLGLSETEIDDLFRAAAAVAA